MKKLLIVDVQKGFLNENCDFVVEKIENLVGGVISTKFSPQNL